MVATENNLLNSLAGSGIGVDAQKKALDILSHMEFPTRKSEDWRYTPVSKIIKKTYKESGLQTIDLAPYLIEDLDANIVVLLNGKYSNELSSIDTQGGLTIGSLAEAVSKGTVDSFNKIALNESEIFTALNTAHFVDGVYVHLDKKVVADKPIHILHINTESNTVSTPRYLIKAESFSEVNIIQSYVCADNVEDCFTNSVTETIVGEGAKVVIDKVQNETKKNNLICTDQVYQSANSTSKINTITVSGDFVRNGLNIDVDGENCTSEMNGLFLLKDKQHVDNHTKVNHLKPHCTSIELYKGVLADNSTGVFNGRVKVFEDAQKIEAYQQNKNILLSQNATMNAKPELEIYADDVKCSHGTTTGQFDEEAVFYLQTRGVSKTSAKRLLVEAFAGEVLEKVDNITLREWLIART